MDIISILDGRLTTLPGGDHSRGLLAVRAHIGAAICHFERGQQGDSNAFTDAIYRCNQAFEGSAKEAYRVLAGKDPNRITPATIEDYLTTENVLRERVMDHFTAYRTKWRNPSTHDYMLDFDENEALLAIVSVTVFAIVLFDQIRSRLAAAQAEKAAPHPSLAVPSSILLIDEVSRHLLAFASSFKATANSVAAEAASEFEGALYGYLVAQFSSTASIEVQAGFRRDGREADIAVWRGEELIAVEVKYMHKAQDSRISSGLHYLGELQRRGFSDAILVAIVVGDREIVPAVFTDPEGRTVQAVLSRSFEAPLSKALAGWTLKLGKNE